MLNGLSVLLSLINGCDASSTLATSADVSMTSGDNVKSDMTPSEITTAYLHKKVPGQEFTVTELPWSFKSSTGLISLEHSRRSLKGYWLLNDDKTAVAEPSTVAAVFEREHFTQQAGQHPAEHWAQLALCAVQFKGRRIIDEPDVRMFNERLVDPQIQVPTIVKGDNGPTLSFWTTSHYRSLHTFYRHEIAATSDGKLSNSASEGVSYERKPQ